MEPTGQEKEGVTCSDVEVFLFDRTTGQRCDVGGSQENSAEQDQMEGPGFRLTNVLLGNKKMKRERHTQTFEQPGVKAPGTANNTPFFPANNEATSTLSFGVASMT